MSMSVELQRALHQVLRSNPEIHEVKVIVHPHLLNRLRSEDEELLVEIERKYEGRLTFRSDPALHHEKFTILNAMNNQELR
jgi:ribonuclease G